MYHYGQEPEGLEGEAEANGWAETGEITADTLKQAAEAGAAWAANAYDQYVVAAEEEAPLAEVPIPVPESPRLGYLRSEAFDANRDDVITRGEVRVFTFGAIFGLIVGRVLFR